MLAPESRVDFAAIRKDFPIFGQKAHGKPLIYLDSTATTQKPVAVLEALDHYYRTYNANIHRGVYAIAEEATTRYEEVRGKVARLLNARSSHEIVFTRGTTESINLVSNAWGRANIGKGDVIVLTEMEHHSNMVPWQMLATERGASIRYIPIDGQGRLDLTGLDALLRGPVKIVSLTHMSNVLGTVNPVAEIARKAHAAGALVCVDAAQSLPHRGVDVRDLDCDFLAFSGHKMLGPTGIGGLYAKRALLDAMPPFMGGGEMIREVKLEGSSWNETPWKFEAGTMNIADTIAFGTAIDYIEKIGFAAIAEHSRELTVETMRKLGDIPGVTIYGPPAEERGGIVAFTLDDIHAHDVATVLDHEGVAVRAGHHCAMPLHKKLGVAATTRVSFYVYNVPSDITALVEGVRKAKQLFSR
ncbi:MAG TPA: cysteine desulfurase [Candidatus Limnocylindrales bacterium]|nr:cysteine desulfurase [Candidatus Limnocylindrales bacterium]